MYSSLRTTCFLCFRIMVWGLIVSGLFQACAPSTEKPAEKIEVPQFTKILVDSVFRSESIVSADINRDGKLDLVIGDVWYEAPLWTMHEIREPGEYLNSVYQEDKPASSYNYYSQSFAVQASDINRDGWIDVISYPVMGNPIYWYENPGTWEEHWPEHRLVEDYHGESPLWVDLFADGRSGSLCGVRVENGDYHLQWLGPGKTAGDWESFTIGNTGKFGIPLNRENKFAPGSVAHGLGIGDLNGDGRKDVLTRHGWYEAPFNNETENWDFHVIPFSLRADSLYPQYLFAQMPIYDIDNDGDADFFASSAHRYGLWWFEQVEERNRVEFVKHEIPYKLSQAHAVAIADLNMNGIPDIVTGKRFLSHNGNDPGWDDPLVLIWMEAHKISDTETRFEVHEIDQGIGLGTQIQVADINGDEKEDVLISNKKGTYILQQK